MADGIVWEENGSVAALILMRNNNAEMEWGQGGEIHHINGEMDTTLLLKTGAVDNVYEAGICRTLCGQYMSLRDVIGMD